MRGFLLDTNILLIAPQDPDALSEAVRAAVLEGPNYISVISYWEVTLKCMKGTLIIKDEHRWWKEMLGVFVALPVLLLPRHVEEVRSLQPFHKDPFDRILIAQAKAEDLTLVTTDAHLALYRSDLTRIVL